MDTAPSRDAAENARRDRVDERLAAVIAALAGRYRVEREVGRGGMATVYLAEDLRHRRLVAVKVLHAELGAALGAERFLREIEVTARLHHPHILPLHDSGEASGLLYYVMPFIEGESLRQRLARERQLSVEEAVRIAVNVAGALDYAHRHGLIHRDVKPENVLLHDGRALVADFGIARAVQRAAGGATLTGTGVSVGTPHYMSPEQAAGERELDARTDVFALGIVTYEMLAGAPPFTAPTVQGVVAKVMSEQPRPIAAERRAVPTHVGAAVMKALEKLPADRFATAAQFGAALAAPATVTPDAGPLTPTPMVALTGGRLTRRDVVWAAVAVALAVGAFATATRWGRGEAAEARPVRFTLAIADSQRLSAAPGSVAISPDGRTIVYVGEAGPGRRAMYRRRLEELTATRLEGTEGAARPFFSHDGQWIAFNDDRDRLKKMPLAGGGVEAVTDLSATLGRTWGASGVIVAGSETGLVWIPAKGGPARPLTRTNVARGELRHADPMFLPDGKTIAFRISLSGDVELSRMALVTLDARVPADGRVATYTTLDVRGGTPLGYADDMLVVGHADGIITATRVDVERGRVTGTPVPVADGVDYNRGIRASLGADGSLVYVRGAGGGRLTLVDDRGAIVGGSDERRRFQYPRFSPDGRRVAVQVVSPEAARSDIWIYDLTTSALTPLTVRRSATRPVWMPDGKRVAYVVDRGDRPAEVWAMPADRGGPEERLLGLPPGSAGLGEVDFSRVGPLVVLRAGSGPPRTNDLWLLTRDSAAGVAGPTTRLLETPFSEAMPRISPDGRWLAYISDETGQIEVYVRPFPGRGEARKVSSGGGAEPVWSPDSRRILYRMGDRFLAASVTSRTTSAGASELAVADQRVLFEGRYVTSLPALGPPHYDVHPDGRRFIVIRPTSEDHEIVVVVDWLAEVRSRVAVAGDR